MVSERIAVNFKTIYEKLTQNGYNFTDFKDGKPLNNKLNNLPIKEATLVNSKKNIEILENLLIRFGKLPLIFLEIYKNIEYVDFNGYFYTWPDYKFLLDPVTLDSLEAIIKMHSEDVFDGNDNNYCVMFSPDVYFKEDVSGDFGYAISLSEEVVIDNKVLFYQNIDDKPIYFMDYLRLCFKWAGFPSFEWALPGDIPDHILKLLHEINKEMLLV